MRVTLNEESQSAWQAQNLEHLRYEYDIKPDDVVIDLGAYRGEWANEIRARYGCCVIAVEPTDAIDGWQCETIKKAAWLADGKLAFGGAYYYTSAYENPVIEYPCFDVAQLIDRFACVDLLKINVEGHEYDILEHLYRKDLLKRIQYLQVQFHLIEGAECEMRYEVLSELLNETHEVQWRWAFCWESWRRR